MTKETELSKSENSIPVEKETGELAEKSNLISDDALLGVYDEILSNIRTDRTQVDELLGKFCDMVINDGDASNASKEALVNLVKLKTDTADKMTKIADLMTRIKLKERDTYKPYLNKKDDGGNLTIIDQTGSTKAAVLEAMRKKKEKK